MGLKAYEMHALLALTAHCEKLSQMLGLELFQARRDYEEALVRVQTTCNSTHADVHRGLESHGDFPESTA